MFKYIFYIVISYLLISCHQTTPPTNRTELSLVSNTNIDSLRTIYNDYLVMYSELYKDALYGDKEALDNYSDLMIKINQLQHEIALVQNKRVSTAHP